MPDIVLDYHRLKTPIDHPDSSITRTKLEYPTANVSFAYLSSINKGGSISIHWSHTYVTIDSFTDKSVFGGVHSSASPTVVGRLVDIDNYYYATFVIGASANDHRVGKVSGGIITDLNSEAVDLDSKARGIRIICSGSTIKSLRYEGTKFLNPLSLPTPDATISTTNTSFASGKFGYTILDYVNRGGIDPLSAYLLPTATPLPPAQAILELDIEGNGRDTPYSPSLSKNLVEISSLEGLPDFLYQEAKRYQILISKGFTEDEIKLFLGYIPQHQVDLDSITWGSFEFHPDKASSVIVTVTGDNPYQNGAIERQKARAKRTFKPPRDHTEATDLYKSLVKDHPYWLAGKDNFIYQTLGLEIFDLLQNIDFYYGELLDHKTHYNQLKQVPDWEIENRINELIDKMSRETVLTDERDKHIGKAREILKRGW
jgi:hypothetical protein